nr:hypothetical protein [Isoptericola sediminis]
MVLCGLLAGWAAWFVVRDRAVILKQLFGAAAVEAVLLVQAVVAAIQQAGGHAVDGPLFWGYLLTAAMLLPLAALWAFAERTKWSSVVLCVAALTVAFLEWRLWVIWEAGL